MATSNAERGRRGIADAGNREARAKDRERRSGDTGSKTGARSRSEMDAKTRAALDAAFGAGSGTTRGMSGATGQASRGLDSQANERAVRAASKDAGLGDGSFSDLLGAALGFATPIEEKDPYSDPDYKPDEAGNLQSRANWGFDTAEAIGGIASAALGGIGGGTIIGGLNDLLDKPIPDFNLGPDVFAGGTGAPAAPTAAGGTGGKELVNDQFGQPTQPNAAPKPAAGPAGLPDIWEYPEEADLAASAPQDGLTDEQRRRRGNTSIVVLGQGGLAI